MKQVEAPHVYELSAAELRCIEELIEELAAAGEDPGGEDFYRRPWELVPRLPEGLRCFLHEFRAQEPTAAAVIRGLPVDDEAIGPTPPGWRAAAASGRTRREEIYLGLLAQGLGEPFTWSTLQEGRMIQNVLPIAGEEEQQSGHGQVLLEWHTEDAFHPHRCDYLLLFGARNQDAVATTLASVRDVQIRKGHRRILAENRFHILPDDEHLRQLAQRDPDHPSLARMRKMRDEPEPVAVLFGSEDDPYLRIDPFFMRCLPGDEEAELALKSLVNELEAALQEVVVEPGSVLLVDNYRAVHGRQPFAARFDGTDRWLKKIVVSRDLRRSRDLRSTSCSRIIA